MYAYEPRTNPHFSLGEFIAEIAFALEINVEFLDGGIGSVQEPRPIEIEGPLDRRPCPSR
jgi:hypothetical protein